MTTTDTADLSRLATPPTFQSVSTVRKLKNLTATVLVGLAFLVAVVPLVWVLYTVVQRGFPVVLNADWWQKSLSGLLSRQQGGGVYHAIYGTIVQGVVCGVISVPIGLFVAVYLVEYGGRSKLSKATTFMVDILTGVPSIVAALFVYSLWITTFGFGRSGFAVSLALVLLMVPVIVRTTEEMLKIVPDELREASYALGIPKWKTIVKIVIPTALSGIITGIMLAIARVAGETAPLLLTALNFDAINLDPFHGQQAALPTFIFAQAGQPQKVALDRAWAGALTLVLLILVLNLIARSIARRSRVHG
jgi:phosphate transport system permease protein